MLQSYTEIAFDNAHRDWDSGLQVLMVVNRSGVRPLTAIADHAERGDDAGFCCSPRGSVTLAGCRARVASDVARRARKSEPLVVFEWRVRFRRRTSHELIH